MSRPAPYSIAQRLSLGIVALTLVVLGLLRVGFYASTAELHERSQKTHPSKV